LGGEPRGRSAGGFVGRQATTDTDHRACDVTSSPNPTAAPIPGAGVNAAETAAAGRPGPDGSGGSFFFF